MNRKHILIIALFGIVTFSNSCTKKGDTGPAGATGATGPAGPSYTGSISGHVSLYDQYGSKVLTGLSTVQLSLNGGSAVSPDGSGYYIYNNVTTGDYNIAASNTGYGATMLNNFQFLKDTLNRDIKLSAIPNFSLTLYAGHNTGSQNDSLVITCTPDTRPRSFIIFVNNSSAVSNTPANYLLAIAKAIPANSAKVTVQVPAQDLYNAGFTSGSIAYYAVYSYVVNDVSAYEDLATGKNVYNAVSNPTTGSAATP